MTSEEEKALLCFDYKFSKETLESIYHDYLPHYILYEKNGKNYDCYCTHCKKQYNEGQANRSYTTGFYPEHNADGKCVKCGKDIIFKNKKLGRKSFLFKKNMVLLKAVKEALTIKCVIVHQYFVKDKNDPQFKFEEKQRYYLSKTNNFRWRNNYGWEIIKTISEPHFRYCYGFYPADNSYTVLGEEEIKKTHLKYCMIEKYVDMCSADDCKYISYLCFLSKHLNVEYLMKTGYETLVMDLLEGKGGGLRLNYKTNDVKKMLGLNKEEFKKLAGNSAEYIACYKFWLKHLLPNGSYSERIKYLNKYKNVPHKLNEIKNITGLNFHQIAKYVEKQRGLDVEAYTVQEWLDYLHQCQKLQYDLTQEVIIKPKNLAKAHDRLIKLIRVKADEMVQQKFEKVMRKCAKLKYIDKAANLQTIIPKSIEDIIDEGKALSHCVGGYAKRCAEGQLYILFLRTIDNPYKHFYTMEVNTKGQIIQCRGYKNNHTDVGGIEKPQYIKDFENEYQKYLDKVFKKKKERITT